ncbi:MAG: winged helix-turn-helix domain-containing protein [Kibdelosporangium sp.]
MSETLFALDALQHNNGDHLSQWRKDVRTRLRDRLPALLAVAQSLAPMPERLVLTQGAAGQPRLEFDPEDVRARTGKETPEVLALVRDFYEVAVRDHWVRINSYLQTGRETTGRILFTNGFGRLFEALHRQLQWEPPVLSLPCAEPRRIDLNGQGLIIVSSLFLSGPPRVFVDKQDPSRSPVLIYPDPPRPSATSSVLATSPSEKPLAALVGGTRANVLHSLDDARSTTELAKAVGISAGSASQHATVLRNAGLITTERTQAFAVHTQTPLGAALLAGSSARGNSRRLSGR